MAEHLGPTAAAKYLRRSHTFVRSLVAAGHLPARRTWTPEELDEAMKKRPPAKPRGRPRTKREAERADAGAGLPGIDDLNLPTGGAVAPPAGAAGGASPSAPTPHTPPAPPAPPSGGAGGQSAEGDFFDW